MAGKFELKKATNGQYHFSLKAGNGEIILTSEQYKAKANAQKGIDSVKENAPVDARYERKTASGGQPYFALNAANGEALGRSQMYSSAGAMEKAIESVKANAPTATVDDLS